MATTSGLRAYLGLVKQSAEGSPASPTSFPRWLDGSTIDPEMKTEDVNEGNLSRWTSFVLKNSQSYKGKLISYPRPINAGLLLASALGTGADIAKAAPASVTAVKTPLGAGSLVAGPYFYKITAMYGQVESKASTEVTATTSGADLQITTAWAADPLATGFRVYRGVVTNTQTVYMTVAAGIYTLLDTGAISTTAGTPPTTTGTTHVMALAAAPDWFTWELGMTDIAGNGQLVSRIQDCINDTLVIDGETGKAIKFDYDFVGKKMSALGTTPASPTYEAGLPFMWVNGSFSVGGAANVWVRKAKVTIKNMPEVEGLQTGLINPQTLLWTRQTIEVTFTLIFQDYTQYKLAYYNAGSVETPVIGLGSLSLGFLQGGDTAAVSALGIHIPELSFKGSRAPIKLSGEAVEQECVGIATGGGTPPFFTVRNLQTAAY